ncbi:unnamed protein product, partial [Ixodes hexagonus]
MPATSTLRSTIRKQNPYSVPATREDLILPGEYKVSLKKESFVVHDSGVGDRNRILVFATQRNLDLLSRSKVRVVHGRDVESYTIYIFSTPWCSPRWNLPAYRDFESAAIIASSNIFPQARVQGCFFHLCQAVYRKVCKLGFQTHYGSDEDFAVLVRMLPALAFLAPAEVPEAFEDLVALFPPEAMPLALYFEDTYLGRRRRNGLLSAIFPTSVWSVHRSVTEGLPRTNNSAEAWHRSF